MDNKFIILVAVSAGTAAAVYLLYQELQRQRRQHKLLNEQIKLMQTEYKRLEGLVYANTLERYGHDDDDDRYYEIERMQHPITLERSRRTKDSQESSDESSDENSSSDSEETDVTSSESSKESSTHHQQELATSHRPLAMSKRSSPRYPPHVNEGHQTTRHASLPAANQARFPGSPGHPLYGYNRQHSQSQNNIFEQRGTHSPFGTLNNLFSMPGASVEVVTFTTETSQPQENAHTNEIITESTPKIEEVDHSENTKSTEVDESEGESEDENISNFDVDNQAKDSEDIAINKTETEDDEDIETFDVENVENTDNIIENDVDIQAIVGGAKSILDSENNITGDEPSQSEPAEVKPTKVYKDTPLNRKLGRVGLPTKK